MAEADFNVIDAVTDVGAVDSEDAMDVEPAQLYEGKPVDSVKIRPIMDHAQTSR